MLWPVDALDARAMRCSDLRVGPSEIVDADVVPFVDTDEEARVRLEGNMIDPMSGPKREGELYRGGPEEMDRTKRCSYCKKALNRFESHRSHLAGQSEAGQEALVEGACTTEVRIGQ